jgi:hypothetical protein
VSSPALLQLDSTVEVPQRLFEVFDKPTFVRSTANILHRVTEVVVDVLVFDKINHLNPPSVVVGRVVN